MKRNSEQNKVLNLLRDQMITDQIERRGVRNRRVINALRKVLRHKFVPSEYLNSSYADMPLPIGYDQTISQPYMVALMTEKLELDKNDLVLEIGTGSGYQTAVLAELCKEVYSIERIQNLKERAKKILQDLRYKNIHIINDDGHLGWADEELSFNAIMVTCAPTNIPEALTNQLKEDGRMIIPFGDNRSQKLSLLRKRNNKVVETEIIPVRFVPMLEGTRYRDDHVE